MSAAGCSHCHGMPKTFADLFHNNGLDAVSTDSGREQITMASSDKATFRVPTLRNIALTAPYMHDGRFKTLEEVIEHYSDNIKQSETLSPFIAKTQNAHGSIGLNLTENEKDDIITFLHALTDTEFINNPEFSDPRSTPEN